MLMSGDVENATELCKHGLVYFPDNISGYAVLARAYLVLGEEDRAANVLEAGYRRTGAEGLRSLQPLIQGQGEEAEVQTSPAEEPIATVVPERNPAQEEEPDSAPSEAILPEEESSPAESILQHIPEETTGTAETPMSNRKQHVQAGSREEEMEKVEETAELPAPGTDLRIASANSPTVPETHFTGATEEHWTINTTSTSHEVTVQPVSAGHADLEEEQDSEETISKQENPATTVVVSAPVESIEPEAPAESSESESPVEEDRITEEAVTADDSLFAETVKEAASPDESSEPEKPARTETTPPSKPRLRKPAGKPGRGGLSIHTGTKISRLRSSNLRLIPGLEFAPLRRGEDLKIRIAPLVNEPPPDFNEIVEKSAGEIPPVSLPTPVEKPEPEITEPGPQEPVIDRSEPEHHDEGSLFEGSVQTPDIEEEPFFSLPLHKIEPEQEQSRMTPLEELARRLETARIPIVEEAEEEPELPAFEPSIVSDTFAGILAGQGAYAEAIKAYQMLARMKPERHDHYAQKIEEMRWKMSSVVDERTPGSTNDNPDT